MPKRKKYPKLPNGFGTIRYLGPHRRNPFAVHPPATERTPYGFRQPAPLCYVDSWEKGFLILNAFKAGTYTPNMAISAPSFKQTDEFIQNILANYNRISGLQPEEQKTFSQVYQDFWKYKYESGRQYSQSSLDATKKAYKNSSVIHSRIFSSLKHADLQAVIDQCPFKRASKELILTFFKQIFAYGEIYELIDKNPANHLKINVPEDDEHGVPFSNEDLIKLWRSSDEETAAFILIMCYSGFRISEYKTLEVNLEEGYFKGGIKTAASKNRIVPIHSAILPLVRRRMEVFGSLMEVTPCTFRKRFKETLAALEIEPHTPHDTRHTFSALCERYGVRENDRKRMLGHSFSGDITNQVYGHRTLDDLKTEIEKILVTNV